MYNQLPGDIFATKGIEYLVVIAFFSLFLIFARLLTRNRVPSHAAARGSRPDRWFRLPASLLYHPSHSWARPESDELIRVGMDDFAQMLLGTPGRVTLPEIGSRVTRGKRAWSLDVDSHRFDLPSPVDGEIVERNESVLENPELINRDPYGEGWLVKIRSKTMDRDREALLQGEPARAWLDGTEDKLRGLVSSDFGPVLQDGGFLVTGFARSLSSEGWDEIARDFLDGE